MVPRLFGASASLVSNLSIICKKYLLILGLILVILCNFVPKSMRMPLRCAVSH